MIELNFIIRFINIGENIVERVLSYKIFGVYLQEDLKWDIYVDYMYKKVCKRFYFL